MPRHRHCDTASVSLGSRLGAGRRLALTGAVVALVANAFVAWAPAPKSGATSLTVPSVSTPQLLHNPSFEEGFSDWAATAGENVAVYSGSAAEGSHFLEVNTGAAGVGAGITQQVAASPQPGHTYRGSVMLRAAGSGTIGVGLVLWAVGGSAPIETATSGVSVSGGTWRQYSVALDVAQSGHTGLMLEVYLVTPGENLDMDAAVVADAGLANASFESGVDGWNWTPGMNLALYNNGAAEDSTYLEMNSGSAPPWVGLSQNISTSLTERHSYQAQVMLRSPSGQPVGVQLAVWASGGPSPTETGTTNLTVSNTGWRLYSVVVNVQQKGFSDLGFQVALENAGANLDVDEASLTDTGIQNAAFSGIGGWGHSEGMNLASYGGSPFEGSSFLEINTGGLSSAGVWQTADAQLPGGNSYDGEVWLRSPSGRWVTVTLRLTAAGENSAETASETLRISNVRWLAYPVDLDTSASHSTISLKAMLGTRGRNLDLGGAALQVPERSEVAPPPPPPPPPPSNCTPNNSCSPQSFADALLAEPAVSGPATAPNLFALETWFAAEGGGAGCPGQAPYASPWSYSPGPAANPLNTVQEDPGSQPTAWNSVGVQQYENAAGQTCWYWGLWAEYAALSNGYYGAIISVLQNPQSTLLGQCDALAAAVGSTPWGTGNFSRDC